MKFALRDDDLNYYFDSISIENNFRDIWEICPVSMSVVPFIYGDWPSYLSIAEEFGSKNLPNSFYEVLKSDTNFYPIAENKTLINYLKDQIDRNRIYITIHGINHINLDSDSNFSQNFNHGSEFYTHKDLTFDLNNAINYLEDVFNQKIKVFTPPQNLLSKIGLNSVLNNKLALCTDIPTLKSFDSFQLLGLYNYVCLFLYRIIYPGFILSYPIKSKKLNIVDHLRLQPGSDINEIYKQIDFVYKKNGCLVLSTHSYAFDEMVKSAGTNMRDTLIQVINYLQSKDGVKFVKLSEIFDDE